MTTLLLLPGMDGTGSLFEPLLACLPGSIDAKVVGYPKDRILSYSDLADLVVAELPKNGPFFILGESFSGPVAIAVAARAPVGLRGLILVCSFARRPRPVLGFLRWLAKLAPVGRGANVFMGVVLMGKHRTKVLQAALSHALTSVAPAVLRHRLASAMAADVSTELSELSIPCLYLQAAEDLVVPAANAQVVSKLYPRTRVRCLEGPHFLLQTQPAAAAQAISGFIGEVNEA